MGCIECGAEQEFLMSLCKECFTKRYHFISIPEYVDVTLCYFCNARKGRKSWTDHANREEAITCAVEEALQAGKEAKYIKADTKLEFLDPFNGSAQIGVDFKVDGKKLHEDASAAVRLSIGVCTNCSRRTGNYFEATLQVRSSGRPMLESERQEVTKTIMDFIEQEGAKDSSVFVTKMDELKTGLDFFLSSTAAAKVLQRRLSKTYGAPTTDAMKVVGRQEGKDVVRSTFLVRLPDWRNGDVLEMDEHLYLVNSIDVTRVGTMDLSDRRKVVFQVQNIKHYAIHRREDITYQAVLVSAFGKELSVLDPVTYETKSVVVPSDHPGIEPKTSEVEVLRIAGYLYLI